MILKNIINILKAICSEYGKEKFLTRIKDILNIDLTHLLSKKTRIYFSDSQIKIINLDDKEKHFIQYEEIGPFKFITFITEYKRYKIIKKYNQNNEIIKKTSIFKLKGDKVIVLDEIDDKLLKCRRIIKTDDKDTDYNNGIFEKEKFFYKPFNISEKFNQYLDEDNCINIEKTLEQENNIFIYFYKERNNKDSFFFQSYTETLCSLDKPNFQAGGRYKDDKSTTEKSLKTPFPNIYIYGREASIDNGLNIKAYNISILKKNNQIQLIIDQASLSNGEKTSEYTIDSDTSERFTIDDINLLINFFKENIIDICTSDIIFDLERIKQKILIKNKEQSEELDFFDLKLSIIDKFENLSYDIFENLSHYETKIQEYIKKQQESIAKLKLKI